MKSITCLILFCLALAASSLHAGPPSPDEIEFFEHKVRPIFAEHCIKCHGEKKQKGSLRLDSKKGWEDGGETGAALVPKKSAESLLIRMVKGAGGKKPEMPPEDELPASSIADLEKWVDMGAQILRVGALVENHQIDWQAAAEFWAFKPVSVVAPPPAAPGQSQRPIDRFIAAKLLSVGLAPNGPADRRTLLLRHV